MARRTQEDALHTKETVLNTAIRMLSSEGYNQFSLNKLAQNCDVTRGAVYHHFKNKETLFLEVVKFLLKKMGESIFRWAKSGPSEGEDLLEAFVYGTRGFLTESQSPEYQGIILVDAPAVLGMKKWQAIDDEYTTSTLVNVFTQLKRESDTYDPTVLAQAFSGAMNQLSRWISNEKDIDASYSHLERMLKGFFEL
jgi:AcrR family transcriptional regulator